MSREAFDDDCPDCLPVLLNAETGQKLAPDDPAQKKMDAVWAKATRAQKEAFHRVTCLNSRDVIDLVLMQKLAKSFEATDEDERPS